MAKAIFLGTVVLSLAVFYLIDLGFFKRKMF